VLVEVTDINVPIENAALNVSIKYASGYVRYPSKYNSKVQNFTDSDGSFIWELKIGKDVDTGTFNITAIVTKEGYESVESFATFEVT